MSSNPYYEEILRYQRAWESQLDEKRERRTVDRLTKLQRESLKRRQLQTEIDAIGFNAGGMTEDERRSYRDELKRRIGNVRI
jgi:hypothetical protein